MNVELKMGVLIQLLAVFQILCPSNASTGLLEQEESWRFNRLSKIFYFAASSELNLQMFAQLQDLIYNGLTSNLEQKLSSHFPD